MDNEVRVQEAIDTCPVSCIHWVTTPQLTLLEAEMAKIERVSAYILQMGCRGGRDVFQVDSLSQSPITISIGSEQCF